jgi:hypothetical protein
MRWIVAVVLAAMLAGCAASGAAWISASQFNRKIYAHKIVAVMPAVLDPLLDASKLPPDALQKAIARQLDILDIDKPILVKAEDAAGVPFPYTPARLAEFGRINGYDAVVGATVIRLDTRPISREWSITGTITFVDSKLLERRWTLAKTWTMFGVLDEADADADAKARAKAEVEAKVSSALFPDFFDVRQVLHRGRTSTLLRRDTVVVDAGPVLGLDVADIPRADSSHFIQKLLNRPNRPYLTTSARQLSVDVFAIDDDGIVSLTVENGDLTVPIFGGRPPMTQSEAKLVNPVYLAQRVGVPLVPGQNDLRLVSMNSLGQKVVRSLGVRNTAAAEVAQGSVVAAVIVADSFASLRGPYPTLLPDVASRIDELKSYGGANLDNGARAVVIAGDNATRDSILRAVTVEWSRPALGTRRVLMFVGRAEMAVGRPYLLLHDAELKYPENRSLSFDELASLLKYEVARVVIDVCTNDTPPEVLRDAVQGVRNEHIDILVSGKCSTPFGTLFLAADKAELRGDQRHAAAK